MKAFVDEVSRVLKIKRKDLVEKDIILHKLLLDLSKNEFFHRNFLFKGGTCLIKCYLGYYRFSEDIDFTWRNQKIFKDLSQKKIRRYLSETIDSIVRISKNIAEKRRLDFRCDKGNKKYVEIGGGNKTVTFKIWYFSEILEHKSFVKMQINFVEKLKYKPVRNKLKGLLSDNKEINILFPEDYKEYSENIVFDTYDIREILCEKIRAILTRRGTKERDFVDIYLISKKFGIDPNDLEKTIVEKTQFILDFYEKYRKNLNEQRLLINSGKVFDWGTEKKLLLTKVDTGEFYKFLTDFNQSLKNILKGIDVSGQSH